MDSAVAATLAEAAAAAATATATLNLNGASHSLQTATVFSAQQQQQQQPQPHTDKQALPDQLNLNVAVALTAIYTLIFVVGLVGNFCFCYVIVVDSRVSTRMKTPTNYYLFSLSVSDMLLLSMGLPHDVAQLWSPNSYLFGSFVCVARGWIVEAAACASVLVIVAFTVERYIAICHPLRSSRLVSKADSLARSTNTIVAIWLIASCCALFVVRQYDVVETTGTNNAASNNASSATLAAPIVECIPVQINKTAFELSSLLFFALPMTSLVILYGKIVYVLRARSKQQLRRSSSSSNCRRRHNNQSKRRQTHAACRRSFRRNATLPTTKLAVDRPATQLMVNAALPMSGKLAPANSKSSSSSSKAAAQRNLNSTSDDYEQQQQQQQQQRRCNSVSADSSTTTATTATTQAASKQPPTQQQQPQPQPPAPAPALALANNDGKQCVLLNSTLTTNVKSVIKMLVSIVIMFFICWAPFHAQRLMAIYVNNPTPKQVLVYNFLTHVSGVSYYISAVINPILYSLFSVRFRQALYDTFPAMRACATYCCSHKRRALTRRQATTAAAAAVTQLASPNTNNAMQLLLLQQK